MKRSEIVVGKVYRITGNGKVIVAKISEAPLRYHVRFLNSRKVFQLTSGRSFKELLPGEKEKAEPKKSPVKLVSDSGKPKAPKKGKKASPSPSHCVVQANAGCGKTTTAVQSLIGMRGGDPTILPNGVEITPSKQQQEIFDYYLSLKGKVDRIGFVAFNTSIAKELKNRVPSDVDARTMHSLGMMACRNTYDLYRQNNRSTNIQFKVRNIIEKVTKREFKSDPVLFNAVDALTAKCKLTLSEPTPDNLELLSSRFGVELNNSQSEIFSLVPEILEECANPNKYGYIDYNDMIWLAVYNELPVQEYDFLGIDEAQDLNPCQQALIFRALGYQFDPQKLSITPIRKKPGIANPIGDENQAIYGFTGADCDSLRNLEKTLSDSEYGASTLYLTETRRCGKAIVARAAKLVPNFTAHESNPDGEVLKMFQKEEHAPVLPAVDFSEEDGVALTESAEFALIDKHRKEWEERNYKFNSNNEIVNRVNNRVVYMKYFRDFSDNSEAAMVPLTKDHPSGVGLHSIHLPFKAVKASRPFHPSYREFLEDGDMVVCRCNAPLVQECFRILKMGKKANIRGRDIGMNLIKLIERMKETKVADLIVKLQAWAEAEIEKEQKKKFPSEERVISINDQLDCLTVFCEEREYTEQVIDRIKTIFTDQNTRGILLSSIHKVKGLEAKKVYFLQPEGASCPHPMAKTPESKKQEWNLKYVADTRAIETLVDVF